MAIRAAVDYNHRSISGTFTRTYQNDAFLSKLAERMQLGHEIMMGLMRRDEWLRCLGIWIGCRHLVRTCPRWFANPLLELMDFNWPAIPIYTVEPKKQ